MILVCGEALIDIFVGLETHDRISLEGCPGGSPFNVAFGLARLGQRAEFFTGLSRDMMGARLLRFLRAEEVGERYLKHSQRPSTLSLVDLTGPTPAYAFYGEGAADRDLTPAELPQLGEDVQALHFGSFSTVVEPVGTTYLVLARREARRRVISYDPNIRMSIEPDIAIWHSRVDAFAACADLIKVSDEDFERLYPGADPAVKARQWLQAGASLVVLTRGSAGARAWSPDTAVDLPAPAIKVVDTVGAGDTFQAALLTALAETGHLHGPQLRAITKMDLERCIAFAIAAAAITCTRRGADLPHRPDLPSLTL